MRLDLYLFSNGLAKSRTEAKGFITDGAVSVNGKTVQKPSLDIDPDFDSVTVREGLNPFVSRGGFKLAEALRAFKVSALGKKCLDIGASSGGFTDCLLQSGAQRVVAVDSGKDQLAQALRTDSRVSVIEGYNARYMKASDFDCLPELAVMDVSFISATYIIPSLGGILPAGADFICLIKPQFEVGRSAVGKGGIVKDEKERARAVERVVQCAELCGFTKCGVIQSPIRGGDGNIEYLAHFKKD